MTSQVYRKTVPAIVTIEYANGEVYRVPVDSIKFGVSSSRRAQGFWDLERGLQTMEDLSPRWEWKLDAHGNFDGTRVTRREFIEKIAQQRVADEWTCEFCHSLNDDPGDHPSCSNCGAARSFIFS